MSESAIPYSGGSQRSLQSGCKFIYDGETGAIFTRTPGSWAKIIFFYAIYYSCLAGFFIGMLSIFISGFIDPNIPRLNGNYSILPQNPGLGFRPQPDVTKALIKFDPSDPDSYQAYIDAMEQFLNHPRDYRDANSSSSTTISTNYFSNQENLRDCSENATKRDKTAVSVPCSFDLTEMPTVMSECVHADYGFPAGQPCVAVKLNRIFHFQPELTEDSPVDYLAIECRGLHSADEDNVGKEIEYFPRAGIDLSYFPYLGQEGYLSPLVFVKFRRVTRNVLVQVVCRPVNAANIKEEAHSKESGRIHFEMFITEL